MGLCSRKPLPVHCPQPTGLGLRLSHKAQTHWGHSASETGRRGPARPLSSSSSEAVCRQTDRNPLHRLPCECPSTLWMEQALPWPAAGTEDSRAARWPSARLRLASNCFFIGKIRGENCVGSLCSLLGWTGCRLPTWPARRPTLLPAARGPLSGMSVCLVHLPDPWPGCVPALGLGRFLGSRNSLGHEGVDRRVPAGSRTAQTQPAARPPPLSLSFLSAKWGPRGACSLGWG